MAEPPASADSVAFHVGGHRLVAIYYQAAGAGPHPAAVLLHGIPGSEKNHDIVYRLRDLGWHALLVHFRGAWGSEGSYDMRAQVDDAIGALDWLLGPANPRPVDPARVALVGYSLGSRAALMAAADSRVRAVVSMAGVADFNELMLDGDFLAQCAAVLNGVTPGDLTRQWASLGQGDQPTDAVARLSCPLLVVHGEADEVIPLSDGQQLAARAGRKASAVYIPGSNHMFTIRRAEMVEAVVGWLTRTLPG